LIGAAVLYGCDADYGTTDPTPAPAPAVLLKDIVVEHLPSPYYHFDYDASGRVSAVSVASDLRRYDVSYVGGRISELANDVVSNRDRLQYVYDEAGRVSVLKYVDASGVFTLVMFSYDGAKLTGVERSRRVTGGFIIDKTMTLSYHPDGNLHQITTHRPPIDGVQDETTTFDAFEQYDDGLNVDGFSLLHDEFFDHLVFLPGVQLQKNNPRRATRTGQGLTFVADYTYTYDASKRPVTRSGTFTISSGAQGGQTFPTLTTFTYY
jgi:hypothetical protein